MRRFLQSLFITFILGASFGCGGESAVAQSPSSIKLRCPSPYGSIYGQVFVRADGNISYNPCPTNSSIFTQTVDFTNATVIGLPFTVSPLTTKGDLWGYSNIDTRVPVGADGTVLSADSTKTRGVHYATLSALGGVTGTGTTNFVPRWTNGAGGVIGNTPFSWNGTVYNFNNTALTCIFCLNFTPSALGAGVLTAGSVGGNTYLTLNEATAAVQLHGSNSITIGESATSDRVDIFGNSFINADSRGGIFKAGDVGSSFNNTILSLDDAGTSITLQANTLIDLNSKGGITSIGDTTGSFGNTKISVNDSAFQVTLGEGASGLQSTGGADTTVIGDFLGAGNNTKITVDDVNKTIDINIPAAGIFKAGDLAGNDTLITVNDTANTIKLDANDVFLGNASNISFELASGTNTFIFGQNAAAGIFALQSILSYQLLRTITAAGTTGNRTINQPNGSVNIAGGNSSVVITNSTVTTSSTIIAVANTNDATCAVKNAVPTANTITVTMTAACTGETRVAFWVWN